MEQNYLIILAVLFAICTVSGVLLATRLIADAIQRSEILRAAWFLLRFLVQAIGCLCYILFKRGVKKVLG